MSEQEKKRQRIYELFNVETKLKFLCLSYTKHRNILFTEKELFMERGRGGLNKKRKEGFLTAIAATIKKDPTTSIRKHANELKTIRTTMKQDLNPNLNSLDYAI